MSKSASSCNIAPDLEIFGAERPLRLGHLGGNGSRCAGEGGVGQKALMATVFGLRFRGRGGKQNSHTPDPKGLVDLFKNKHTYCTDT